MSWTDESEKKITAYEMNVAHSGDHFNANAKALIKRGFLPSGELKITEQGVIYQAFAVWSEE